MISAPIEPDFDKRGGLLPAIVQDVSTLQILMLGWINREAWNQTRTTGLATFWSTSRDELWQKGSTSGDTLLVREIRLDCDQDAVVYLVSPQGQGACHTRNAQGHSRVSCFFRASVPPFVAWKLLEP